MTPWERLDAAERAVLAAREAIVDEIQQRILASGKLRAEIHRELPGMSHGKLYELLAGGWNRSTALRLARHLGIVVPPQHIPTPSNRSPLYRATMQKRYEDIQRAWGQGVPIKDIALRFGISPSRVRQIIRIETTP